MFSTYLKNDQLGSPLSTTSTHPWSRAKFKKAPRFLRWWPSKGWSSTTRSSRKDGYGPCSLERVTIVHRISRTSDWRNNTEEVPSQATRGSYLLNWATQGGPVDIQIFASAHILCTVTSGHNCVGCQHTNHIVLEMRSLAFHVYHPKFWSTDIHCLFFSLSLSICWAFHASPQLGVCLLSFRYV